MCATLCAKRIFKVEFAEQRFESAIKLLVTNNLVSEMYALYILSLLSAEQGNEIIFPVVQTSCANAEKEHNVCYKFSELVAGRLAEAPILELEERVTICLIPVGEEHFGLRFNWRRK